MKRTWHVISVLLLAALLLAGCDASKKPYAAAQEMLAEGRYAEAAEAFAALGEYEDAQQLHEESVYEYGRELLEAKEYAQALAQLEQVPGHADSTALIERAKTGVRYMEANTAREQGNLPYAAGLFLELADFEDAAAQHREIMESERYLNGFVSASAAQNAVFMLDSEGRVYRRDGLMDATALYNASVTQIENARWLGTGANSLLFVDEDGMLMQYQKESDAILPMHNGATALEDVCAALYFQEEISYVLTLDGKLFRCTIAEEPEEILSGIARIKSLYPVCAAIGYGGDVWHWNWDEREEAPARAAGLSGVRDMEAQYADNAAAYILLLMQDGTVWAYLPEEEEDFPAGAGEREQVPGLANIAQIAGCHDGFYARGQDGSIRKITFGETAADSTVTETDFPKAISIKGNAYMQEGWERPLQVLHILTEDGTIFIAQESGPEEMILFDTQARAELAEQYAQAAALDEKGDWEKASAGFLALGAYVDAGFRGMESLFGYYDEQFNAGVDLSTLSVPFREELYAAHCGQAARTARSASLEKEMDALGYADFLNSAKAAKSPVEVTGKGIYVYVAAAGSQKSASQSLKTRILQDVPFFFIAEKPENARYIVVIDASYSRAGKYTDGAAGYSTSAKVYVHDTLTGKRIWNKSYKARPPKTKYWGSGDAYGSYSFLGAGNGYEKDIKNYLEKLATTYKEPEPEDA